MSFPNRPNLYQSSFYFPIEEVIDIGFSRRVLQKCHGPPSDSSVRKIVQLAFWATGQRKEQNLTNHSKHFWDLKNITVDGYLLYIEDFCTVKFFFDEMKIFFTAQKIRFLKKSFCET